jgi:pimeloyl-ACP methyl ester carboxylesterase
MPQTDINHLLCSPAAKMGIKRSEHEHRRPAMTTAPIILVPGFWLGAWAWDDVAATLRAQGHVVTALTLPGFTFDDHVDAIVDAVRAADAPPVLAVHSAAGFTGYAASDRVPDRIAAMVYVDTAPGIPPQDADFTGVEKPLDWAAIEAEENLDGLTEQHKETFRQRAIPVPGGVLRGTYEFTNDARRDIPSTIIATSLAFLAGIPELRDLTGIDLPTSHWPMWSRPDDLSRIIGEVATKAAKPAGVAS